MKPTVLTLLFTALPLFTMAQAADPATAPDSDPPKPAAPKLTDAQVNSVLGQLTELEKDILAKRSSNLTSILARLRGAMASDAEALKLYLECDRLVNASRKEVDKSEARAREEQKKKELEKRGGKDAEKEVGDFGLAVRLQIHYLVLTLEAHEAKDEEFKKMVPKLQTYIGEALAAAPKLKGRAYGYLNGGGGGRGGNPNIIVEAFQLERYLQVDKWTNRPLDFGGMYIKTILPLHEDDKKELLPGLWDARINAEMAFRKEQMFEAEYNLWLQNDLPALRWNRANYLYEKGPSPILAMSDMLKLIKENPSHPDAPAWVKQLRSLVNQSSPNAANAGEAKAEGT